MRASTGMYIDALLAWIAMYFMWAWQVGKLAMALCMGAGIFFSGVGAICRAVEERHER